MYAMLFDINEGELEQLHPQGLTKAYVEMGAALADYGFCRIQGNVYITENEDMAKLFLAIQALRAKPWFPKCVRHIRAFSVDQWSDFTPLVK